MDVGKERALVNSLCQNVVPTSQCALSLKLQHATDVTFSEAIKAAIFFAVLIGAFSDFPNQVC